LFVHYGQLTARREEECAKKIANKLGIPLEIVRIEGLCLIAKSALLGNASKEKTEVPGRNAFLLGLAAAYAQTIGASVAYGATHIGVNYSDCTPLFVEGMQKALREGYGVDLLTPMLFKSKKEIVEIGKKLGVDFNDTYACYFDPIHPCMVCESCRLRREALEVIQ